MIYRIFISRLEEWSMFSFKVIKRTDLSVVNKEYEENGFFYFTKKQLEGFLTKKNFDFIKLAIQNDTTSFVDNLLEKKIITLEVLKQYSLKEYILGTAAEFGYTSSVKWFYDKEVCKPGDIKSTNLILYEAAYRGRIEIIQYLFDNQLINKEQIKKTNLLESRLKWPRHNNGQPIRQKEIEEWLIKKDIYTQTEINEIKKYVKLFGELSPAGSEVAHDLRVMNINSDRLNVKTNEFLLVDLFGNKNKKNTGNIDLPYLREYLYTKFRFFEVDLQKAKELCLDNETITFLENKLEQSKSQSITSSYNTTIDVPISRTENKSNNKMPTAKSLDLGFIKTNRNLAQSPELQNCKPSTMQDVKPSPERTTNYNNKDIIFSTKVSFLGAKAQASPQNNNNNDKDTNGMQAIPNLQVIIDDTINYALCYCKIL